MMSYCLPVPGGSSVGSRPEKKPTSCAPIGESLRIGSLVAAATDGNAGADAIVDRNTRLGIRRLVDSELESFPVHILGESGDAGRVAASASPGPVAPLVPPTSALPVPEEPATPPAPATPLIPLEPLLRPTLASSLVPASMPPQPPVGAEVTPPALLPLPPAEPVPTTESPPVFATLPLPAAPAVPALLGLPHATHDPAAPSSTSSQIPQNDRFTFMQPA